LEARLNQVIDRGLVSGRFGLLDPEVGAIATAAAVVGVVAGVLGQEQPGPSQTSSRSVEQLGASTAATMLSALGLDAAEARLVAARPATPEGGTASPRSKARNSDRSLLFVRTRGDVAPTAKRLPRTKTTDPDA
jgi:hypothetical protein